MKATILLTSLLLFASIVQSQNKSCSNGTLRIDLNTESIVFHQIGTPYFPVKPKVVSTNYDSNFITLKYIEAVNENKLGLYYSNYIARDTAGTVVDCWRYVRIIDSISATINHETLGPISIFPNPVKDKQFNIHFGNHVSAKDVYLELFDLQGRQVFSYSFHLEKIDFLVLLGDLSLDNGMYNLKINVGKERLNKMIFIQ